MTHPRPSPETRAALTAARALAAWQRLAGPFWPYVGATPFISPYLCERPALGLPPSGVTTRPLARASGSVPLRRFVAEAGPAAWLVDRPVSPWLEAAGDLAALGFWVVPLVQRWLVAGGVLAPEPVAAALLAPPRRARDAAPHGGVVFLLDGERSGRRQPPGTPYRPRGNDNRYEYTPHVFPPASFLAAQGITRVRWLAGRTGAAPDLAAHLRALVAGGQDVAPAPPPTRPGAAP